MRKASIILLLIPLLLSPVFTFADTILAPGSNWEYTFSDPTSSSDWNTTTGTAGWQTGPAPFGNATGTVNGDFDYNTFWPADTIFNDGDLWVRTPVDLTGFLLATILWDLGVDNGYKLYLNGDLISSDNIGGFTSRWEYSGDFSAGTLNQGVNIIALELDDWGQLTAFDMQITGDRGQGPPGVIPEPTTMLLFGFGLLGIAGVSRRKK